MTAAPTEALASQLQSELADSPVYRNHPIGPLTTYRVGGPAAVFVLVESRSDLDVLAVAASRHPVGTLTIGRGSNLLVSDAGFPGLVVQLGEHFAEIASVGSQVSAGAAAALPVVARRSVTEGLTGFEWAVGVPGSIGGAVRMNAGGHGSDMAANLVDVDMVDLSTGQSGRVAAPELELAYRSSSVASTQIVVSGRLELAPGDPDKGRAELSEIVRWRRENQPGGQNAGSVFTNPEGDSAGRLIDQCGLKSHRVGTAQVSPKHANFIQADPGGSARDIVSLMKLVVARVRDETGISLTAENRLIGFEEETLELGCH